MGRPQKSVVYKLDVNPLGDMATKERELGRKVLEQADKVRGAVHELDWKGATANATIDRGNRDYAQVRKAIEDGHNKLAQAYENGKNTMGPMIDTLKSDGKGFEDDNFDVSEDWKVTDKFPYDLAKALAGGNQDILDRLAEIQRERANEADTGTTKLQKLADELGVADENTSKAITEALTALGTLTPARAGLVGGQQATGDGQAILDGKATPEQIARARAALTGWTPEQIAALAEGKPADMPQGQYDYLKSLMESMNGKSVQDINAAMEKYGLQGAMGDGIRMMGNPNVQTALGSHGGLDTLPDKVHGLLTDNNIKVGTTHAMVPLSEFNALNKMLDPSNKALAKGSDVDRALLSQSAKIAGAMNQGATVIDMAQKNGESWDGRTPGNEVNKVLNGMVSNANIDHQAVTDFLGAADHAQTAPGAVQDPEVRARLEAAAGAMNRATDGHFGGNQAFVDLVTHKFDDGQTAVKDMFGWQGAAAHAPGLEGQNAATSASATAHLLSENVKVLGAEAGDHSLGRVNPELSRTMMANMTPFIGNLVDVQTPGIQGGTIDAFDTTRDLTNLAKVFNTDPVTSQAFHAVAAGWENYFAHEYGANPQASLAQAAGNITQAINAADVEHLNTLKDQQRWEDIKKFAGDSADWDSGKSLATNALKVGSEWLGKDTPWGKAAEWLSRGIDVANPQAKLEVLGSLGPGTSETQWSRAMTAIQEDFRGSVSGPYHQYALTGGYLATHPDAIGQFRGVQVPGVGPVDFVDPQGKPHWNNINQYENYFTPRFSQLPIQGWGDNNSGYGRGMTEPYIEKPYTAPTFDPSQPPSITPPR
ncbi:TPR repeat region-containing protein [Mycobacteroides abscessus]|uniref:TPR repeat region-containing protein n=2 Tax=Mycobacteroides abscessus TaxID=36809 RepID=UPI0009A6D00F|nr:hypothetical protein [Mycobacteroides abscessus]SLH89247.1 Uncharacterised protein [Mycobacteroides abscessus subsp. abscessus]